MKSIDNVIRNQLNICQLTIPFHNIDRNIEQFVNDQLYDNIFKIYSIRLRIDNYCCFNLKQKQNNI